MFDLKNDKYISTVEVSECIPTDEDIKKMTPPVPEVMIPNLKNYGINSWSFS